MPEIGSHGLKNKSTGPKFICSHRWSHKNNLTIVTPVPNKNAICYNGVTTLHRSPKKKNNCFWVFKDEINKTIADKFILHGFILSTS